MPLHRGERPLGLGLAELQGVSRLVPVLCGGVSERGEAERAQRRAARAHRAGHEVYVWTLNDPAWMLAALSKGVDGLITDVPAVARQAVERRNAMGDAQRFVLALMIRLGARTEALGQARAGGAALHTR